MAPRQIAPVGLVLALTVAGFLGARQLGERDQRRESVHRADVAAAQIHGKVNQAADLTESLRRFLVGHLGVTTPQFADLGSSMLSAVGLASAAWVERVPAADRAAYERRVGNPIVATNRLDAIAPAGLRTSYLPATLVTGYSPATVPGVDLSGRPGVAAAVSRASTLYRVTATPPARLADGTLGLFFVESAQRVTKTGLYPGFAVLFVPQAWLIAAADQTAGRQARLRIGETASRKPDGAPTTRSAFVAFGQRFEVLVPTGSVRGAAVVLPWFILGCGLVLAAFAGALGVNAARRAKAQRELDHIFNLSPDLIAVADFNGYFTRVNPAFESTLGYTADELLRRPFIELVHPDDRERTLAETAAIGQGQTVTSFENRYVSKDGSYRWLQWNSTPVVRERQMYAVARDVTEHRGAELELREAQERYRALAEEQAALRRVATLVANGVPPADLFRAVAEEVGRVLGANVIELLRFDPDETVTVVSGWTAEAEHESLFPIGSTWTLEGESVAARVFRTGRPARIESYEGSAPIPSAMRAAGIRSGIGSQIVVDGRIWAVIVALSTDDEPFPAGTESRLSNFTDLVATAIANAEARSELAASRLRIVATADDVRRRIERDLHDGAQQQLVTLALALRSVEAELPPERPELREQIGQVAEGLSSALGELREMSQGIHPAILSKAGLGPALRTLARRSAVPVELDIRGEERLPEQVEVAVYYVVSEALANAEKHAHASGVHVSLVAENDTVRLSIRDDGVGGANPEHGSGLIGLRDRVEALGGTIEIASAAGRGTSVLVTLPLDGTLLA